MNLDLLPEDYRPKIVKGKIFPKGRNFIYKASHGTKQVELPLSMADLVLLCDGRNTIQQILTKVYEKQGVVQFQKILDTLFLLYRCGLLEIEEDIEQSEKLVSLSKIVKFKKDIFILMSSNSIQLSERGKTTILYVMALFNLLVIGFGFFRGSNLSEASSLFVGIEGITATILLCLILINIRSLVYFVLDALFQTLPATLAFRLGLRDCGFATDLEGSMSDFSMHQRLLFLSGYLTFPAMFGLGAITLNVEQLQVTGQSQSVNVLFMIGFICLYDLFPHAKRSVGRALLKELEQVPNSSALTDFGLFLRTSNRKFNVGLSISGIVWSLVALSFLGLVMEWSDVEKTSLFSTGILTIGFVTLLFYSHQSFMGFWYHHGLQVQPEGTSHGPDSLNALELLDRVSLFSEIGDAYLKNLIEFSELITTSSGSCLFNEGDEPKDLYLLVSGVCEARNNHVVAEINPGSVFGESALLESGLRQASVIAKTDVIVLKIPIDKLSEILKESGHLESLKSQIIVNQYFCSSKHFINLRRSTIERLERSGHIQTVGSGVDIFKQGDVGDGIYFIVRGRVKTEVSKEHFSILEQGDIFGEISVLARIPRTATVVTQEPCLLFKIASDSFWEILLSDIRFAYHIEKLSETRLSLDMEALLSLERVSGDKAS